MLVVPRSPSLEPRSLLNMNICVHMIACLDLL